MLVHTGQNNTLIYKQYKAIFSIIKVFYEKFMSYRDSNIQLTVTVIYQLGTTSQLASVIHFLTCHSVMNTLNNPSGKQSCHIFSMLWYVILIILILA